MFEVGEGEKSLQLFWNSFQSQAAENWNERRPNEVLALGMISEIPLLDCVLRVGVAIVTSELR